MRSDRDKKHELCLYRLKQADEALEESRVLRDTEHYRGAINRAYYGMFYAIQMLIVLNKVKVSKHSGAIAYFDREFVKPGIIDKKFSKWLHRLFDLRQDADYGDMYEPDAEQCGEALEHAEEFISRIRQYYDNLYG